MKLLIWAGIFSDISNKLLKYHGETQVFVNLHWINATVTNLANITIFLPCLPPVALHSPQEVLREMYGQITNFRHFLNLSRRLVKSLRILV